MDEKEKMAFLKKMGYSGSVIKEQETQRKLERKKKENNIVDKQELVNVYKIFFNKRPNI